MGYAVIKGVSYVLAHTPDILIHNGSAQVAARAKNDPQDNYLTNLGTHLRPFSDVVSYPANQCYIGNITPQQLSDLPQPWFDIKESTAAEGKYGEAVHTLLFRSIQDIDLKRPNTIRRSLTSREIAGLDILTPATRDAFSLIGRVVENSYFGGQPIGQPDFQKCRDAYVQFAVPQEWVA